MFVFEQFFFVGGVILIMACIEFKRLLEHRLDIVSFSISKCQNDTSHIKYTVSKAILFV